MLESVAERLMETVHAGSPTKHPARRLETIAAAGELKIPFTSGILVGIGETEEERMASLAALAEVHGAPRPPAGDHPPELRPPSELLRPRAGRDRRRRRRRVLAHRRRARPSARRPGVGFAGERAGHDAAGRRDPPADARDRHPGAAQPRRLVAAAGPRGRHRSRRPERQRRSHLARASLPVTRPRSASAWPPTGSRCPSGCASTPSTSRRSGSRRRYSTSSPAATGRSSPVAAVDGAPSCGSPTMPPPGRSSAPATGTR